MSRNSQSNCDKEMLMMMTVGENGVRKPGNFCGHKGKVGMFTSTTYKRKKFQIIARICIDIYRLYKHVCLLNI